MNTQELTSQNNVGDFVNRYPDQAIAIFNGLGIDFCCGGNLSLKRACDEKNIDPEQILSQLMDSSEASSVATDWAQLDLTQLVDHIVSTHHNYLKDALPRITEAMKKVVNAHGKNHPQLFELEKLVQALREDLEPHLMKEENVLFPMIRKMNADPQAGTSHCGSLANPIRVMLSEHDNAGILLEKIKALSYNYSLPDDACATFTFLYQQLRELEADTHLHVHKENNLLFPQVLNAAV